MKKILIFSLAYYPDFVGGAEVAIKEITDRISPEIFSFDMVTAKMNKNQQRFERIGNINVYRVGLGLKTLDKFLIVPLGFLKAVSLNKENNYYATWSMMANQSSVTASIFKIFLRKVPLILTIQEGDEESYLKRYVFNSDFLYKILIRPWHLLVFKLANRATAISLYLKKRIEDNNFIGLIDIIPNGVDYNLFSEQFSVEDLEKFRKKIGFKKKDKIIVTTSRLVEKNAVEDIILSLKYLPKDYHFLCLGVGPLLYKLQNLADKEGLYDRVKLIGFVKTKEIPKYLNISNVFVRPSLSEGFGISFIEAMASGVPVVTTPVGGIPDFLTDRETGLFCKVRDPKSIAEKIKLLDKDQELRSSIIKNAKELSRNKYDWNLVSKDMSDVFSSFSSEVKNIVITSGIFPPKTGGPAIFALNLAKEYKAIGHNISIVTYGFESIFPTGLRHIFLFFKLLIKSIHSDFIVTLDTFSVGLPAIFVKKILKKKVVLRTGGDFLWENFSNKKGDVDLEEFYKHKDDFDLKTKIIFKLTQYTLKNFDALIFSTSWQRDIFTREYFLDSSKNYLIENAYKEKQISLEPERKNFLWGGRDIPLKNLSRLKKSFSLAQKEQSGISLDINLNPEHNDFMSQLKRCYAFILPSISDISPNLVLSAISFNKPFIVTKHTGIKDRIKDIGLFIDPLSVEDIKEKIVFLADEGNYKVQKKKIEEFDFKHSYKDIAKEILEIADK
jgi:glycosyltransferase involved in cell wall biosynthesis